MQFSMTKNGMKLIPARDKFTIGTYYIAHYPGQAAKRLVDVNTLSELGFDYIATPIASGDTALFSLCRDLGMGIMAEYNDDPATTLAAAASYGVVFAHIPGDDVDINFANAAAYASEEATYQAYNTNLLTLASVAYVYNNVAEFAGTSDLTGIQSYPIGIGEEMKDSLQYHQPVARTACTTDNSPMLTHVQLNQWRISNVTQRSLTVMEFNYMAWAAIQYGADGILFYAAYDYYTDGGNQYAITDIFENTDAKMDLRCAIKNFIADVRRYEHFFLRGTRSTSYASGGITSTWTDSTTGNRLRIVNSSSGSTNSNTFVGSVTITVEKV